MHCIHCGIEKFCLPVTGTKQSTYCSKIGIGDFSVSWRNKITIVRVTGFSRKTDS